MHKIRFPFGYLLSVIAPLVFFFAVTELAGFLYSTERPERPQLVASAGTVRTDGDATATVSDAPETSVHLVAASAADPDSGAKVFNKCKACHTADKGGANKIGPNLWGVIGRPVASVDGFKYSDGMRSLAASEPRWTPELLDQFLTKPKALVPATKMSFAGLRKADDRANLIAWLASLSDTPAANQPGSADAGAADAVDQATAPEQTPSFLDNFRNPPPMSEADLADITARVAALSAEIKGLDYERARFHPLHFPPAINSASDAECLVCHQEILDHRPRATSPAGVPASDTIAWYQTLATYDGPQASFHYRHLESPYAKAVMNLQCNFCHKGNDPREESPDMMRGRPAFSASATPEFTNRKMVNPSTTCLRCHGAFPYEHMEGVEANWPEVRQDFEDEDTPNGCLTCHGEYGFRTNRHNVTYLNARTIEDLATASSDVCFGCHGGRQWYRISYPYPRHPWPDMDEETPDWAVGRATESDPEYQLAPANGQ